MCKSQYKLVNVFSTTFKKISKKFAEYVFFFFMEKSVVMRSGVLACQTIKIVEFMIYMYHLNGYLY